MMGKVIGRNICALLTILSAAATAPSVNAQAVFEYISYEGSDPAQAAFPAGRDEFRNPVLPGFHPDPSILRVGGDYYIVNSSFGWLPGLPIYHSRDLVNWTQIGNAIDNDGVYNLQNVGINRGIFAPTIRWHGGQFYIITTCIECGSNFIISAKNPKGPWSKPLWLPQVDGIDPDLFFDDDGRVWITNNGEPEKAAEYDGHRALWIQEYDPAARRMIGARKVIVDKGTNPETKPIWSEGPHIIKKDGYYYLIAAEGGTSTNHSQTVFRSKAVTGPYLAGPDNPILTQRDLDPKRPFPVTATGHTDFVKLPDGTWWTVFLANRPYEAGLTNLGRETFMLPVDWSGEWPKILPQGQSVPLVVKKPNLKPRGKGTNWAKWRDEFTAKSLGPAWLMRRGPAADWLDLKSERGALKLGKDGKAAFVGRRQHHENMTIETAMKGAAVAPDKRAGLAAVADEDYQYFFGLQGTQLIVAVRDGPQDKAADRVLASVPMILPPKTKIRLRITAKGAAYSFAYAAGNDKWQDLLANADGRVLATEHNRLLFTGTVIGPYAGPAGR
jgi:xylan 1,4-beta-xylosidase